MRAGTLAGRRILWLVPVLLAVAAWWLVRSPPRRSVPLDPAAVAAAVRESRQLPVKLDEATRLDAVEAEGSTIVVRETVTAPPATGPERDALHARMAQRLVAQSCTTQSREWLRGGIALRWELTIGRPYAPVVVREQDCE